MKTYEDFAKEFDNSEMKNETYLKDAWIQNALRTQLEESLQKQIEEMFPNLKDVTPKENVVFKIPNLNA